MKVCFVRFSAMQASSTNGGFAAPLQHADRGRVTVVSEILRVRQIS
jgi:hypothetical protein